MTGNEAIARGAWEAGVRFASAYPGTPSTEILEAMAAYSEVRSQWSVNEKTALEGAFGACLGGVRSICAMKHVGLNVAADPLFSSAYTGVNAGLVIVTADDPGCHSSQNEQDNRMYARFAKLPLLEPSDSQEALDFVKLAFEISEQFDTPVLLRTTTRISHGKSPVITGNRIDVAPRSYSRTPSKYVLVPANARPRHTVVEERLARLADFASASRANRVVPGSSKLGVITHGAAAQYAMEALGSSASYLILGMSFPFPAKLVEQFASSVEQVIVVEELEPFIEESVRSMGIPVEGKALIPREGELNTGIVARALGGLAGDAVGPAPAASPAAAPARPPMFCAGCPHRGVFFELAKLPVMVYGDIGCYALGAIPPFTALDTCIDMGASISGGAGFQAALEISKADKPVRAVAVIGDSTFFHSGMTGLLDSVYNSSGLITMVLDNRITAMTGHQENPGSGFCLNGSPAPEVHIEDVARALGIENVITVSPFEPEKVRKALVTCLEDPGPSVIIARGPCALLRRLAAKKPAFVVDQEKCRRCKACLKVACPALYVRDGQIMIDEATCMGCGVCAQACRFGAIANTVETGEGSEA